MTSDERMVTIAPAGEGEILEGLFLSGKSAGGVVMAPPHPLYGGSMDSPVVNEVAHAAGKHELASLRFNWRGVGASAGERSGEAEHADADYRAALTHLSETVAGGLVVVAIPSARWQRCARWQPNPASPEYSSWRRADVLPDDAIRNLDTPCLIIAAEEDDIAALEDLQAHCEGAGHATLDVRSGGGRKRAHRADVEPGRAVEPARAARRHGARGRQVGPGAGPHP